jgi:hypothetical protein
MEIMITTSNISVDYKTCSKCKQLKTLDLFPKDKSRKDGFNCNCKECCKGKVSNKEYNRTYYSKNKLKQTENAKKWQEENKEKVKDYFNNPIVKERRNKYRRNWDKKKYQNPIDKLYLIIGGHIRKNIKDLNVNKNKSTLKIVGLNSWEDFKNYIESLFIEGMTWNNYGIGKNNETWHIDHITPISSATTEEEVYKLNHYTNLRPMWCSDNIKKSNKHLEILT